MKLEKVLVLHKKSTYQIQAEEHHEERFIKLLEEDNKVVERVKLAHREHVATLDAVCKELELRNIDFRCMARAELELSVKDVDLMITVGGDGTFLDASHFLSTVPILGVNSSSSSSFGHFCVANRDNFKEELDRIESGEVEPANILRLDLKLNGSTLPERVLNEVLIAHDNPAATSRYFVQIGDVREEQRSSGLWVGTPAGSTGSLRSAGGVVQPIIDQRFQYFVREPCLRPGESWKIVRGLLEPDETMHVVSQMRTGALYIDGQHIDYRFALGDQLEIAVSDCPLRAFVNAGVNAMFEPLKAGEASN